MLYWDHFVTSRSRGQPLGLRPSQDAKFPPSQIPCNSAVHGQRVPSQHRWCHSRMAPWAPGCEQDPSEIKELKILLPINQSGHFPATYSQEEFFHSVPRLGRSPRPWSLESHGKPRSPRGPSWGPRGISGGHGVPRGDMGPPRSPGCSLVAFWGSLGAHGRPWRPSRCFPR